MRRGGGGLIGAFIWSAVLFTVCLSAASRGSVSECVPCRFDAGRQDAPPGFAFRGAGGFDESRAGVFATVANPYMLEGLVACDLAAGFDAASCSAWLEWRHMGHALYREDRVAATLGAGILAGGIRLVALPALERREVRGIAAERSQSLSMTLFFRRGERACIGIGRSVYRSDPRAPRRTAVSLGLSMGPCAAAFSRVMDGSREDETRVSIQVRLGRTCHVSTHYRWETGELSCGLLVERAHVLVGLSWSQNPALGSTISAGVGRWWRW